MSRQPKTAAELRYAYHTAQARRVLADIRRAMAEHAQRAARNPGDWGYVGDMSATVTALHEVANNLPAPCEKAVRP